MSFYETVAAAGVGFREGQVNGLTCPKCGKANVNLKIDKHWATCFTAGCDFKIRGEHQNTSNWVIKFFEVLAEDWLAHFQGDGGEAARKILIQQRHIHPAVLKRLPIGCIPPRYDLKRAIQAAKVSLVDDEDGWAEELDGSEKRSAGAEQRKKVEEFLQGSKRTGKDGTEQGRTLQELVHSLAGWWAFLYQDKNGDYIAANLRCPWEKRFFKIQPLERMGIFAPMDANEPKPGLYADCKGEWLCFEGEVNHLQFLSQIVREALKANPGAEQASLANLLVPSCALGGVSSWDLETLSGYTLNPVFCYDNDGPDKGITRVEKASPFTNKHGDNLTVLAFTTPTKDADDFFRGGGNLKQFSELWRSARKLTVPLAVVRERIDEMRRSVKRKNGPMKYQVEQTIAEFVWKDLNERGRFFHSGGLGLIFLDGDKEPIEISGDGDKFCNLMIDYGLYPADQLKHFVGRFLGPQAARYGTPTELHLLSYYDKQQNTVWLSEYDGNVLRITPEAIQRVPNGTDGVLFKLPEGAEPYKVNLANITGKTIPLRYRYPLLFTSDSFIHRFITSTVQYQENNLTTRQYELLYLALLMTLFMPGLLHTKPLMMFLGESGSGKTMLGERAGWLLRGSKFAAVDMPDKKEDFENLITNTPFAVIDNVGKLKSNAFQSLLAIAATGGAITKRELYSTNKQVEYRIQASLWLSAITSPFKGDEMANRIVPFHTCKRDTYIAASEIKEEFMAHRDEMMTEVVARLQRTLRALEATKGERIEVKHRMADFVAFVLRVAGHEGWRKDADYMFECMASDQEDYATEDDAVLETIANWLANNEGAIGRWHTPSQLDQEWRQQASTCGTAIPWEEGNTKALGWYVRGNMNILRKRLGLQVQRDKHSKANVYSFVPNGDSMEDIRAACRDGYVHNDRDEPLDDL